MANVVIFGLGRGASVGTRYLQSDSTHEVVAYTVDEEYAAGRSEFMGKPVVPFSRVESEYPPSQCEMFAPLGFQGMNTLRSSKYLAGKAKGYTFASYVSSRIIAAERPVIGENCLILEGNVFNYDVKIGNDVVLWSANQIGDLSDIGDHVWISSHCVLSGEVTIDDHAFLGINATVSNFVKVGARSYVGANTLIAKDTPPDSVYVAKGTPQLAGIDSLRFLDVIKS